MSDAVRIQFQPTSDVPAEFLHELNDASLLRNGELPAQASREIRRQQIAKLRSSLEVLRGKRNEFLARMDEYISKLQSLLARLESQPGAGLNDAPGGEDSGELRGTYVRCLACDSEALFGGIQVVYARESDESFLMPTELYVLEAGVLKKGTFACRTCGSSSLLIRSFKPAP